MGKYFTITIIMRMRKPCVPGHLFVGWVWPGSEARARTVAVQNSMKGVSWFGIVAATFQSLLNLVVVSSKGREM